MGVSRALRSWARVWRAEGAAAVRDRVLDRWSETRHRLRVSTPVNQAWPEVPVLNVIGVEVVARGGGVPLQLLARLRRESEERPIALLARQPHGGFGLECWSQGRSHGRIFPRGDWSGDPLREERGWLDVVRTASTLVGARAVHVENFAGLSLSSLTQLAEGDLTLIVSMHDFAAFCRRPNLWQSSGGFCDYSTDADRCRRCLSASAEPFEIDQSLHRSLAAQILGAAEALVFPSHFLHTRLAGLIGWGGNPSCEVVSPGIEYPADTRHSIRRSAEVAFIGGGADHKGGTRLPRLARAVVARGAAVTVYGGNGHHNLLQLRRIAKVAVRGYFRAGSLPTLLARQRASVALLLSGFPETFSLALSEAWAAGVPVVAPALGALPERLQHGGGHLLSADPSDDEVLGAIDRLRQLPVSATPPPPTATDAARRHLELYRRRGLMSAR